MSRLRKTSLASAKLLQILPVQTTLPDLVARLNRVRPVRLRGDTSVVNLRADEQEAVQPVLVVPTSEGLRQRDYDRIDRAFQAEMRTPYVTKSES